MSESAGMCWKSWPERAAPHTSAPFIPSALSLLRCPFSLHALCSLGRLRSAPSRPHQTLVHLLHLLRSGVWCWGGGMCLRLGLRKDQSYPHVRSWG